MEGGEDGGDREGRPAGMTREEAERLLDGVESEERGNQRRLAEREARASGVRREKDW
jgi:hypothetical protein